MTTQPAIGNRSTWKQVYTSLKDETRPGIVKINEDWVVPVKEEWVWLHLMATDKAEIRLLI